MKKNEQMRLAAENWDKPIVITTNVQFFESLYASSTSKCRKLHNIAGSVIILDEAQMIPTNLLLPCVRALIELVRGYHCTILLCTATQPSLDTFFERVGMPPKEIVHDVDALFTTLKRVSYENAGALNDEQLADMITNRTQVLCIVNSKKQARNLYKLVKLRLNGNDNHLYHLSTSMTPQHRSRTMSMIKNDLRNDQCRVIATSVIEAGVDIDFPYVMRAMTGIDSIIQAAGRCNREGYRNATRSKVVVFETMEDGKPIYRIPSVTKRRAEIAIGIINDFGITNIDDINAIHEYFAELQYYDAGCDSVGLDHKGIVKAFEKAKCKPCAGKQVLSYPFRQVARQFQMIPDGQYQIIIAKDADERDIKTMQAGYCNIDIMRRIMRYSVSVYKSDLFALKKLNAVSLIKGLSDTYVLDISEYYDDDIGLDYDDGIVKTPIFVF